MVAVGDDELLVGHGRGEHANRRGIADAPEPVEDIVLIGDFGVGWSVALVEDFFHASGWVGVEHENLAKMRVRGLEQVEPVAFWLGKRLLMAEDDLLRVVVELAKGDKA